jgi:hypothetical protein
MAYDQCLELAIPWADLHIEPDYTLNLIAVFADQGEFRTYIPENELIFLQSP